MMNIKLADIVFNIENKYDYIEKMCREYQVSDKAEVLISVTDEEIQKEQGEENYSLAYLETLAVYRKIAEKCLAFDTLLFHGSAVAVDNEAYLFTAKSGTGKSTHTRLWREYFGERAVMVNDDKPLLKINNSGVTVCGTPWDGKHRLSSNIEVPLKAVCILERAEDNHIKKISKQEAYPMLLQQTFRPRGKQEMLRTLKLLDYLADQVSLYRLGCNQEPLAAAVAFEGMQKGEIGR